MSARVPPNLSPVAVMGWGKHPKKSLTPVCDEIVRVKRDFMLRFNRLPTHVYLGPRAYMKWRLEIGIHLLAFNDDTAAIFWHGMKICERYDEGVHVVWDGSV